MTADPKEVASLIAQAAADKKARDVVVLDLHEISVICDYFVICSGNSSTQVKAIAENIEKELKAKEIMVSRVEGKQDARWVLLDYASVVAHVFQEDERSFYSLEHLWGDARVCEVLK